MKSLLKLLVLAVAFCAAAFAGTVTDSANVFGPKAQAVSDAVASLPVWIETLETPPTDGLKTYADAMARKQGERAFYVVITTKPREWRVSMHPVGLASSEGVRMAGEAMVARFKRGQFAEGAVGLAQELARLAEIKPAPAVEATKHAPQEEPMSDAVLWCWIVGGFAVVIFTIWGIHRLVTGGARDANRVSWSGSVPPPSWPRTSRATSPVSAEPPTATHHHHYSSGGGGSDLATGMMLGHMMGSSSSHSRSRDDDDDSHRRSSSSDSFSSYSTYDSSSSSSYDSSSSSSDSSGGGGSWD